MYHNAPGIAVLCHLFYPDKHEQLFEKLKTLIPYKAKFFFNLVDAGFDRTATLETLAKDFPGSIVIQTPHKGRDIGGKLSLLNVYFNIDYKADLLLFIHDKQSPHIANVSYWLDELLKILDKGNLEKIFRIFQEDEQCGLLGSQKFIENEYRSHTDSFTCTSNNILKQMLAQYEMAPPTFDFLAGTIFWARAAVYEEHFKKHNILENIASLESGNVLDFSKGSRIHSWERFLSWIASEHKYKITGI